MLYVRCKNLNKRAVSLHNRLEHIILRGTSIDYNFKKISRRQNINGILVESGTFFINRIKNILIFRNELSGKIAIYKIPEFTSIELDEPDDWKMAEILMNKYVLNKMKFIKNKAFCNRCRWCIN